MEDVLQRIEQKIDAMGGRFDKVDEKFDQVDARFAKVDERFDQIDARFGKVDERFDQVDARFSQTEVRLNTVEGGLSGLTMMVHRQGVLQEAMRGDIKQTLERVIGLRESTDRRFDEVMAKLDERVQPIELATRYLATKKPKARG